MTDNKLQSEAERLVRVAEVRAVAEAIRGGRTPVIGDILEYELTPALSSDGVPLFRAPRSTSLHERRLNTYQFAVQAFHLAEAAQLAALNGSAAHNGSAPHNGSAAHRWSSSPKTPK
jgi:hypothetical protein